MKNFKTLTIAALMTGAAFTLNSCGGGESSSNGEEKTDVSSIKLEDGLGHVQLLVAGIESDVKIDKATTKDLQKFFDFDDEDDEYLFDDDKFDGYRIDKSYTMNEGVLNSVSYNTFYDDDKKDQVEKDCDAVLEFLEDKYGKSDGDTYHDWDEDDYSVSFSTYEDGYSFSIRSHIEKVYEDIEYDDESLSDDNCMGDIYSLRTELTDLLLTNLANGKIAIGSSTQADIEAIFGNSDFYDAEYDGLRVSASFDYGNDILSYISFDYFYDCEGSLEFLDSDKELIVTSVNDAFDANETFSEDGNEWNINGMKVDQTNYDNGYGLYVE